MNDRNKKQAIETIRKHLVTKDNQGYSIINPEHKISYSDKILYELWKLENLSLEYSEELLILSKDIRKFLWTDSNQSQLYNILFKLNELYKIFFNPIKSVDLIVDYITHISMHISVKGDINIFEKIKDDVYLTNAKIIIRKKWENVLASDDGSKSFIELFDDIFTYSVEKYEESFLIELNKDDILCRMVKEKECGEERFIPHPNVAYNRWNPPGKTYLYLSYSKNDDIYNDDLTLGEYVCLLECRTEPGEDCCFARFKARTSGKILDLSYNDVTLEDYRNQLLEYESEVKQTIWDKFIGDSRFLEELKKSDTDKAKKMIDEYVEHIYRSECSPDKILNLNIAKQVLKMICQSIYTKVDEESDKGKEKAYKSFHLLSEYLESKGITGIVYPCTRTNKIIGKNIVLFNVDDAAPIKGSIKKYHFNG